MRSADACVAELDGRVVAFALGHELTLLLRGVMLPAVGIGSVTTHPAYRRRGLASAVVHELVRAQRARGVPLGLLRPLSHEVYRGGGWALADETIQYRLNPLALPSDAAAHRRVRPVAPEDRERIVALHDAAVAGHTLALVRSGARWDELLASADHELAVSVGEGGIDGYVLYRVLRSAQDDDEEPSEHYKAGSRQWEVVVHELVSSSPDAWRGLWSLLGSYDARHWVVTYAAPRDRPLHPFLRHAYVDARVEPGYMLRILDPDAVLQAIGAAGDPGGDAVALQLEDPSFPEHPGAPCLAGASGTLALGVGRLAQLLAGYRSLDELVAHGLVAAPAPWRRRWRRARRGSRRSTPSERGGRTVRARRRKAA